MTIRQSFYAGMIASLMFSMTARAEGDHGDQPTLDRNLRREAILGNIPRIEELLKWGANINGKAPYGETALDYAIRSGRHKAAIRLIELGADPALEDDYGVSPLYRVAGDCNASRVVEVLLDSGADVNHHDLYGRTALMNAAHSDCVRTVAIILERARGVVDIDARNDSLQSASDLARNGLVPEMLELGRKRQREGTGVKMKFKTKLN